MLYSCLNGDDFMQQSSYTVDKIELVIAIILQVLTSLNQCSYIPWTVTPIIYCCSKTSFSSIHNLSCHAMLQRSIAWQPTECLRIDGWKRLLNIIIYTQKNSSHIFISPGTCFSLISKIHTHEPNVNYCTLSHCRKWLKITANHDKYKAI